MVLTRSQARAGRQAARQAAWWEDMPNREQFEEPLTQEGKKITGGGFQDRCECAWHKLGVVVDWALKNYIRVAIGLAIGIFTMNMMALGMVFLSNVYEGRTPQFSDDDYMCSPYSLYSFDDERVFYDEELYTRNPYRYQFWWLLLQTLNAFKIAVLSGVTWGRDILFLPNIFNYIVSLFGNTATMTVY